LEPGQKLGPAGQGRRVALDGRRADASRASGISRHILICFHDFSRGGTERIAIGMARFWVEAGHRVTILCGTTEGGLRATVDPRVEVIELSPPVRRSPISRLKLGRAMAPLLAGIDPDIIFLPGNFHFPLVMAFGPTKGRAKIVAKVSNPAVPGGLIGKPVRALIRRFAPAVDGIAAMNSGLARELAALAPTVSTATLYDPIYLQHDMTADGPHADDGRLHVLWAGRFERQKDAALALRTIAALNAITPARLTMLGDGSLHGQMLRKIRKMGLSDVVAAPGYVPGIDPWLRRADVFLCTSHFEGGPAVAVEALAHGVPVVSTDCSHFLHDIMTVPEAGVLVPGRSPQDLARAVAQVAQAGPPPLDRLQGLIAHLEPAVCAQAYLDWFEAVLAPA